MNVLEMVREHIECERLLEHGSTIVVGVSGGPDSLCLLHILARLQTEYEWIIHVAHLNHCLRGPEADEDMLFVAKVALDWGLPCSIEAVDVKAVAQRRRLSLEETARQVRYGFLRNVAHRVGAVSVAVGHNADDQSETVLMHFLRGAGLAGMRGMSPSGDLKGLRVIHNDPAPVERGSDIQLVRPLLSVPRAEIERYCQENHLSPRFDRSNLDTSLFRNRLRHHLVPLLETYNPNIRALLRRTASVAAADYELLTQVRDDAWDQIVMQASEHAISFSLAGWMALPLALQRATLRRAAFQLCPQLRDVEFVHIRHAVEVATGGATGAQAILPQGLRLTVGYQDLRLAVADATREKPHWPVLFQDEPVPVAIPGQTVPLNSQPFPLSESNGDSEERSNWRLEARPWKGDRAIILNNPDPSTAYLDADKLDTCVMLRRRRASDRFQPLGMGGHSIKVADFMVNAKIPRSWRKYVPLLVRRHKGSSENEEIAWIVGWRIDERVKITPKTRQIIVLHWMRS